MGSFVVFSKVGWVKEQNFKEKRIFKRGEGGTDSGAWTKALRAEGMGQGGCGGAWGFLTLAL
jgi:hypothetical protein